MEVSSHALAQERVFGVPFDVAVFTNLTRDHLDYHKTMDEYFAAKRVLFEGCGTDAPRAAVTNLDDEYGAKLAGFSRKRSAVVLTYGWERGDFHAENVDITPRGTRFDMATPQEKIASLLSAHWARECRTTSWPRRPHATRADAPRRRLPAASTSLTHVPGRFERVDCGQPFTVVVDYAHTDDALRNLTALAREFVSRGGGAARVITVFGCGGDRDRAKRPLMGEAAGRGSDFVVLTSDNPRSEDPRAIINDALVGLQKTGVKYSVEVDRRKAIALAIAEARPGDIVLLAGKGHEKVQVTREGSHPFDDVEVAREALRASRLRMRIRVARPEIRHEADALENRGVSSRHVATADCCPVGDEVAQGYSIDSRTMGPGNFSSRSKANGSTATTMSTPLWKRARSRQWSRKIELHRYPDKTRLLAVDDTLVALQTSGHRRSQALGQAAGRRYRFGREDDDQRSRSRMFSPHTSACSNRKATSIIISDCRSCS